MSRLKTFVRVIVERPWLRVGLAVVLLILGLAPVGAPILSDNTLRQALRPAVTQAMSESVAYRSLIQPDGASRIQRSQPAAPASAPLLRLPLLQGTPGNPVWENAGVIPETVVQLEPAAGQTSQAGQEKLVFALTKSSIWRSLDAGSTWSRTPLPDAPMSLAVGHGTTHLLVAGGAANGLYRSLDDGQSWQAVGQTLGVPGAGALGVSALAINPDNENVVYAAPGYWLGTSEVHFTPMGLYTSTDFGAHWFTMTPATANAAGSALTGGMFSSLEPVTGRPLAVVAVGQGASYTQRFELAVTPSLIAQLNAADPALRGAVAEALGLSGNHAVLPALLQHLRDGGSSGADILAGDRIAEAIGRLGDPTAIPDLRAALSDSREAVRERAAYGLGLLRAEQAVPELADTLRKDSATVAERAALALANIGTPAALSALVAPLSDAESTPARHAAMTGLEQAGVAAAPQLTAAMGSSDAALRGNAAEMLGWTHPDSATPKLAAALHDGDPAVRSQAAWALGQIGTLEARQALQQAALIEKDPATRTSTLQALAEARATVEQHPDPALTFGSALMEALSQVPATSWTLLGLAIALAAIVLASGNRRGFQGATDRGA
jgi:HEAT repeat protein